MAICGMENPGLFFISNVNKMMDTFLLVFYHNPWSVAPAAAESPAWHIAHTGETSAWKSGGFFMEESAREKNSSCCR
jgi:hypothetical protein